MIIRLREQIIEQIKQQDRFRSDLQQLQQHHKMDMREREQIEELLNRDLAAAKDEIRNRSSRQFLIDIRFFYVVVLQSIRTDYDRIIGFKKDLEVQLEDCANELRTTKAVANSLTNQLKEKMEQISAEKVENNHLYKILFRCGLG